MSTEVKKNFYICFGALLPYLSEVLGNSYTSKMKNCIFYIIIIENNEIVQFLINPGLYAEYYTLFLLNT